MIQCIHEKIGSFGIWGREKKLCVWIKRIPQKGSYPWGKTCTYIPPLSRLRKFNKLKDNYATWWKIYYFYIFTFILLYVYAYIATRVIFHPFKNGKQNNSEKKIVNWRKLGIFTFSWLLYLGCRQGRNRHFCYFGVLPWFRLE